MLKLFLISLIVLLINISVPGNCIFPGQQTGSFVINRNRCVCSDITSCMVMDPIRCQKLQVRN